MRAFLYFVAFTAACGQFLLCSNKLKGLWKLVPTVFSLVLTLTMYYITEHSAAGVGTFPFPSGFGLYLVFIMCTAGATIGLVSWFFWWILFQKSDYSKEKLNLIRIGFIFGFFLLAFFIYFLTD